MSPPVPARWRLRKLAEALRYLERLTRPVDPKTRAALERRWAELPQSTRTPAQTLGRAGVGCEGTHGVFPRCNFACSPCYHSKVANRVRVDGPHTTREVSAQMAFFESARAPHAHAQLIGGEVTLLHPDDHAAALVAMRRHGREPMSFSHGDFDYDYLEQLAVGPDGRPRFHRLSFAGHFDTTMTGRRASRHPETEEELDGARMRFCDHFRRLRAEHGVRFFLAHNMTVTPSNLEEIPGVIARCRHLGFNMFSFQPAAFIGDQRRWGDDYHALDPDRVWEKIEEGAGARLPRELFQVGHEECNRTAFGFYVGDRWYSVLDSSDPRDLKVRDGFLAHLGGVHFNAPLHLLVPRLLRVALRHLRFAAAMLSWAYRTIRRVGVARLLSHRIVPMTFVMHRFMDADQVRPAWELLEAGVPSEDPIVRETQERLSACSYGMAHPLSGRIVPACVQHAVLDPQENERLAVELPLPRRRSARPADSSPLRCSTRN